MQHWLVPEKGPGVDDDRLRCIRYEKVRKQLDDPKTHREIQQLAKSRIAGIWRIKRAKIILDTLKGKSVDRMVVDIRVPPESIITCQQEFADKGSSYFREPVRIPTEREAAVEKILGTVAKQLPDDWEKRYNYRPVLLETFVQSNRFRGTCYRAANWIHIGITEGYSLYGHYHKKNILEKNIYVYPLDKNYRENTIQHASGSGIV